MNEFESKQDYNFAEYLYDNGLIKSLVDIIPGELMAWWAVEGGNYVKYCRTNDYYFEKLGDF